MNPFMQAIHWLSGDASGVHGYMPLWQCMNRDVFWVTLTVALDLSVAAGYALIAWHWWRNEKTLEASPAKKALGNMRNIFLFCCICGYIFIPVKLFWPAWRLYDMFLMLLVFWTWKYAWGANDLKVVYSNIRNNEQLTRQLDQSRAELAGKDGFLNAVSHDLRTPLNGLALQSKLAEKALAAGNVADAEAAMAQIRQSVRATAAVLDRFIAVAAVDQQSLDQTRFVLAPFLRTCAEKFQPAIDEKNLYVKIVCPAGLSILSDQHKLSEALRLLIANAVKFTDAGSVVLRAGLGDKAVQIDVLDTGRGISEKEQSRLSEDFFQADNIQRDPNRGSGLGLTLARRLVRQLGGHMVLESKPGRGTRLTVMLSNVAPQSDAAPPAPMQMPVASAS